MGANKLTFQVELDANGFTNGIRQMERAAAAASTRMQSSMASHQNQRTGQVFNATDIRLQKEEYAQFWQEQLTAQQIASARSSAMMSHEAKLRRNAILQRIADEKRAAAEEAKSASLASIGWIRMLREKRAARRAEHAESLRLAAEEARQRSFGGRAKSYLGGLANGLFGQFLAPIALLYSLQRLLVTSVQVAISMQRLHSTFKVITGSSSGAASEIAFLRAESDRLGVSMLKVSDSYVRFSAAAVGAGLGMKQTRFIFSSITEAGVILGLNNDRLSETFLALEQMLSKGRVSMEEVRKQLGNAFPGAINIMARSLNMTLPQLYQAIESGSLDSAEAVTAFARQVKKEFKLEDEANQLVRDLARLETAWQQLQGVIGGGTSNSMLSGIKLLRVEIEAITSLLKDSGDFGLIGTMAKVGQMALKFSPIGVAHVATSRWAALAGSLSATSNPLKAMGAGLWNYESPWNDPEKSAGPEGDDTRAKLPGWVSEEIKSASKLNDLYMRRLQIFEQLDRKDLTKDEREIATLAANSVSDQIKLGLVERNQDKKLIEKLYAEWDQLSENSAKSTSVQEFESNMRRMKALSAQILDEESLPEKEKAEKAESNNRTSRQSKSDSLTSVGNFLGSSKTMIESLAQKQIALLGLIEKNTRPTSSTGSIYSL